MFKLCIKTTGARLVLGSTMDGLVAPSGSNIGYNYVMACHIRSPRGIEFVY
jgi:hypothetical protein